jgi:hypothetical protein
LFGTNCYDYWLEDAWPTTAGIVELFTGIIVAKQYFKPTGALGLPGKGHLVDGLQANHRQVRMRKIDKYERPRTFGQDLKGGGGVMSCGAAAHAAFLAD